MFIITAKDDYNVETRFSIGCVEPAKMLAHALEANGYVVRFAEGEIPMRDADEVERAQAIMQMILSVAM